MQRGRRTNAGAIAAVALVAIALCATLAPVGAVATDSDLKHSYAFRLPASNGYRIIAVAASQRADGRGEFILFVAKEGASVTYAAPATVTATRIDADLGALGSVALEVVPSGRTRTLRATCADGSPHVKIEPPLFRGSFEFHGEEGFAEAASSSPREYTRFFSDLLCLGPSSGEDVGPGIPGARLWLHSRRGANRISLQVNKNRPGARVRLEVETEEKRQRVSISRFRTFWFGSSAFDFDRSLRTAALAPPPPFSGRAVFRRDAPPAKRWGGDLSVDLPGRSDVALTGSDFEARLVRACRHEGDGRFRC